MPKPQAAPFAKLFQKDLVLLDGALGTELEKSILTPKLPWSLDGLIDHPDRVQAIHARYIRAGADVITINAFRTNQRTLERVNWDDVKLPADADVILKAIWENKAWDQLDKALTHLAVRIAQKTREQLDKASVCVAGNITTVEDCFSPEQAPPSRIAYREHQRKANHLAEAGVDLILIETMNAIAEAEVALKASLQTGLPVWISFVIDGSGALISGESFEAALDAVETHRSADLSAVLLNCCFPEEVDVVLPALAEWAQRRSLRFGVYANVQAPDEAAVWRRRSGLTPQAYLGHVERWINMGASIVGGCCGTTPLDIQTLHQGLRCSIV